MASSLPGSSSSAWRRLASSPAASSVGDLGLLLGRQQPVDEPLHLVLGVGADEAVDDLAVLQRVHGRDRLHLERLADRRVLVDVDLGQHDLAVGLVDDLLEDRAERPARPAPRRPQVDDDGHRLRPLDDLGLERGIGDIDVGHASTLPSPGEFVPARPGAPSAVGRHGGRVTRCR